MRWNAPYSDISGLSHNGNCRTSHPHGCHCTDLGCCSAPPCPSTTTPHNRSPARPRTPRRPDLPRVRPAPGSTTRDRPTEHTARRAGRSPDSGWGRAGSTRGGGNNAFRRVRARERPRSSFPAPSDHERCRKATTPHPHPIPSPAPPRRTPAPRTICPAPTWSTEPPTWAAHSWSRRRDGRRWPVRRMQPPGDRGTGRGATAG